MNVRSLLNLPVENDIHDNQETGLKRTKFLVGYQNFPYLGTTKGSRSEIELVTVQLPKLRVVPGPGTSIRSTFH